jgi:hypothetical protein
MAEQPGPKRRVPLGTHVDLGSLELFAHQKQAPTTQLPEAQSQSVPHAAPDAPGPADGQHVSAKKPQVVEAQKHPPGTMQLAPDG